MRKIVMLILAMGLLFPAIAKAEYNFGDNRSVTLTTKAWEALEKGDVEAVLAYTNRCIELYGEEAKKMQASLTEFPKGNNQEIFNYWALNDVGTCLYIQGEAYRKANMNEEAKEAYKTLEDNYGFAQCWDNQGWFWKPAEAAKERLTALEGGVVYDFGDYRSETLATKAWQALNQNDLDAVLAYTNKCVSMFQDKAKEMQATLSAKNEFPWKKEEVFSYWALNDVGTCLFIQGEAYRKVGNPVEAKRAFDRVVEEFSFAQCWDPKGWFWKPVDAAKEKLAEMSQKG